MFCKKMILGLVLGFLMVLAAFTLFQNESRKQLGPTLTRENQEGLSFTDLLSQAPKKPSAATPTLSPTPTPRPLTLAEMNERYGPCAYLPTLMYHHVEDLAVAQEGGYANNVSPQIFRQQMSYLQDHGYTTAEMAQLAAFFEQGTPLPQKSVLLTFDDGYADFASQAWPILNEFGFEVTVFLATGLMENPGYLSWLQIKEINQSGKVLLANHTWSHKNVQADFEVVKREIMTADQQLIERTLGSTKVFAYPHGLVSNQAQEILKLGGYTLAFTIQPGMVLCQQQKLALPRVRIGNGDLSNYGL